MPFQYSKDEQVFVSIPETSSGPSAKSTGPSKGTAVVPASSVSASSKWHEAIVTHASDLSIKVHLLSDSSKKDIEIKSNELETRMFPKSAVKEFLGETNFDLAALPKSVKTRFVLECFLKGSNLPSSVSVLQLACGKGGALFLGEKNSSADYEHIFASSASSASESQRGKRLSVVCASREAFTNLLLTTASRHSNQIRSQVENTLDNLRRLLSWFFGDENYNLRTSILCSSSSSSSGFNFVIIPQFTLATKSSILPNGESPSSIASSAASELGISSSDVDLAVSWLLGIQKLWRLTPAASGFKGTEPDLIEAASYLLSTSENETSTSSAADSTKFLADLMSTDKANSKAPAAQFDEKRAGIAQCVVEEILSNLFFSNQREKILQILESPSSSSSDENLILFLSEIPSLSNNNNNNNNNNSNNDPFGLEIKSTPISLSVFETLKMKFAGNNNNCNEESNFEKLISKMNDVVTHSASPSLGALENFDKKPSSDVIKSILSALTSNFPSLQTTGKDGYYPFVSNYLPSSSDSFKFSPFSWGAKILAYRTFFHKSTGGSKHFDTSLKIVQGLRKIIISSNNNTKGDQEDNFNLYLVSSASNLDELVSSPLLLSAIDYFRSKTIEVLHYSKIESLRCVLIADRTKLESQSLRETANALLEKMAKLGKSPTAAVYGSYDSENLALNLSVLGKIALDQLQNKFAEKTLSHIFKRLQYRNSALLTLHRACKRTVQTVVGTGLLYRLSAQIVAEKAARKRIGDFLQSKIEARMAVENDESQYREFTLRDQLRGLASVMGESGAFLKPLLRRRKDRALRDEMEARMETMTREVKERRNLINRFFDEEPDEAIPAPTEALEHVRKRYELVKPVLDEEEEKRKEIVGDAREVVVKLFAVFEAEKDRVRSTVKPKQERTVPWQDLEKAAARRRLDEERAFSFLFGDRSISSSTVSENSRSFSSLAAGELYHAEHSQEVLSPSAYHRHQKQQEKISLQQQQQALLLQRQRDAQNALLQQQQKQMQHQDPYQCRQPAQNNISQQQQQLYTNTISKPTLPASSSSSNQTILNEKNQKPGPAPLRVSFSAYWANQYKK